MTDIKCPNGCTNRPWGVELQGVYDGVAYWTCPACGANWHRWPVHPGGYNRIRETCERAWAAQKAATEDPQGYENRNDDDVARKGSK